MTPYSNCYQSFGNSEHSIGNSENSPVICLTFLCWIYSTQHSFCSENCAAYSLNRPQVILSTHPAIRYIPLVIHTSFLCLTNHRYFCSRHWTDSRKLSGNTGHKSGCSEHSFVKPCNQSTGYSEQLFRKHFLKYVLYSFLVILRTYNYSE